MEYTKVRTTRKLNRFITAITAVAVLMLVVIVLAGASLSGAAADTGANTEKDKAKFTGTTHEYEKPGDPSAADVLGPKPDGPSTAHPSLDDGKCFLPAKPAGPADAPPATKAPSLPKIPPTDSSKSNGSLPPETGGGSARDVCEPVTLGATLEASDGDYPDKVSLAWDAGFMWETAVNVSRDGYSPSMVITSDGTLHAVYARHNQAGFVDLIHAWKAPSECWETEVVAAGGMGNSAFYTDIATDLNDTLHVSYLDTLRNDVKYAWKPASGQWAIEVVGRSNDSVLQSTSIDLDYWAHSVHIAYVGFDNDAFPKTSYLKHSWRWRTSPGYELEASMKSWTTESVAPAVSFAAMIIKKAAGRNSSYSSRIHIAYQTSESGGLDHAWRRFSNSNWTLEEIDSGQVGSFVDIALENLTYSPRPLIVSYYDFGYGRLKFARKVSPTYSGPWDIELVETLGDRGEHTSIGFFDGPVGHTYHISYRDVDQADLKHAWKIGSTTQKWHKETLGDTANRFSRQAWPLTSPMAPYISSIETKRPPLSITHCGIRM